MSRPVRPSGQRWRDTAISPFSTRVKGAIAAGSAAPIATVRVMSVVPSGYCAPLSTSSSSPGFTARSLSSVTR